MVTHLNYGIPNQYGGHTTGTVCGRENRDSDDGTNSTSAPAEVTCKLCLKIMANPKHWRHRKYICQEEAPHGHQ